jgi:hypothetical protein
VSLVISERGEEFGRGKWKGGRQGENSEFRRQNLKKEMEQVASSKHKISNGSPIVV